MKKGSRRTSDAHNIATTRTLTRILTYLEDVSYDTVSSMVLKLVITTGKLKDGLLWLENHGLIFKVYIRGVNYYATRTYVPNQKLKGGKDKLK